MHVCVCVGGCGGGHLLNCFALCSMAGKVLYKTKLSAV